MSQHKVRNHQQFHAFLNYHLWGFCESEDTEDVIRLSIRFSGLSKSDNFIARNNYSSFSGFITIESSSVWHLLPKFNSCSRFLIHNRIPGILALIDCTVVKIVRPSVNEEAFFNHEHRHSLNVQVVYGENLCIYDVRICPGSNNDRNVWKYSDAQHYMRNLRQDNDIVRDEGYYYILGDSG